MTDIRILRIVAEKPAGSWFIVTDESQVTEIVADAKLRIIFINVPDGPVNTLMLFSAGNKTGLKSIFGEQTRSQAKRGNFGLKVCNDAIKAGPIGVINLRVFDDTKDKAGIAGFNPNIYDEDDKLVPYRNLFNTDQFWKPSAKEIVQHLTTEALLTVGNVGVNDVSIFTVKAKLADVKLKTTEAEKTLEETIIKMEAYPALNPDMIIADTCVTTYIFANKFDPATVTTNKYYGQYFNNAGEIDINSLDDLANIAESGFIGKYTGTLIPNVKTESGVNFSIDSILNNAYTETGVIAYINDDMLEQEDYSIIDTNGINFFDASGTIKPSISNMMLSHVVPASLTKSTAVYPLTSKAENVVPTASNWITHGTVKIDDFSFEGSFEQGIRTGDKFEGINGIVKISQVEVIAENVIIGSTTYTYTKVKFIADGPLKFTTNTVKKLNLFVDNGVAKSFILESYKPRKEQFCDGSASKQKEILDIMLSPEIVSGIATTQGARYFVDAFKSYMEASYKYHFGELVTALDDIDCFTRNIISGPFHEDIAKSTNPLFRQMPGMSLDLKAYLGKGGNPQYSRILLSKFKKGSSMSYEFGFGDVIGSIVYPVTGLVSNLFYSKTYDFSVVANSTGYVDGMTELEINPTIDIAKACEDFRMNYIINTGKGNKIYQNMTMYEITTSSLAQITNSELLCYVKYQLWSITQDENFKSNEYSDYLRLEQTCKDFMDRLVLAKAIQPDYVVTCSEKNNPQSISKLKIKLVEIEYTAVNTNDKIIFSLKLK